MSHPCVLLDRDGTINVEVDYALDPDDIELVPGAVEGLRRIGALGFGMVVVTNQSPIGRGMLTRERLEEIHARLRVLLADEGVEIQAFYVCPHTPEDGCDCRKPRPGLALRAARELDIDLARSFVIGDHAGDMGLGRAVGATTILVRTGHGQEELAAGAGELADHVVADLAAAADLIGQLVAEGVEP